MNEFYSVININTGKKVCECSTLEDAQMIVGLNPANRAYRKDRFILDQIIDVTSTTDKQLPGQLGLPFPKQSEFLNRTLAEGEGEPIDISNSSWYI